MDLVSNNDDYDYVNDNIGGCSNGGGGIKNNYSNIFNDMD
jgi:hypothetical protein